MKHYMILLSSTLQTQQIKPCSIPKVIYHLTYKLCTNSNSIYWQNKYTAHKCLTKPWLAIFDKNTYQNILIYMTLV